MFINLLSGTECQYLFRSKRKPMSLALTVYQELCQVLCLGDLTNNHQNPADGLSPFDRWNGFSKTCSPACSCTPSVHKPHFDGPCDSAQRYGSKTILLSCTLPVSSNTWVSLVPTLPFIFTSSAIIPQALG